MSERKRNNPKNTKLNSFLKQQFLNGMITLVIFSIITVISVAFDIGEKSMLVLSLAFVGPVSFICGALAGIKERKNGIICGIVSALPINIILITVSLILNSFKTDINILITLLTGVAFSAVGGIVAVNIRLK